MRQVKWHGFKSSSVVRYAGFVACWLLAAASPALAALEIAAIGDQSVQEDATLELDFQIAGVASGTVQVSATSSDATVVPNANILHLGTGSAHTLIIAPEPNKSGRTTITVSATGASGTDTETFALTVVAMDDAPTVAVPGAQEISEDGRLPFGANAIVVGDIDAGDADVEVTIKCADGILERAGTTQSTVTGGGTGELKLRGSLAKVNADLDGVAFQPKADFTGTTEITVKIDDLGHTGQLDNPFSTSMTALGRIPVTVKAANDPPTLTVPGPLTTDEDVSVVIGGEDDGNHILVDDPDAGEADVSVTLSLDHGILRAPQEAMAVVEGENTPRLVLTGDIEEVNATLNGVICRLGKVTSQSSGGITTYQVEADWNGEAVLTVEASDLGNTGDGGVLKVTKTVPITVTSINDAPVVAVPTAFSVNEDEVALLSGSRKMKVTDPDAGDAGIEVTVTLSQGQGKLTLSDAEEDGDVTVSGGDTEKTLTGSVTALNAALPRLVYTPAANWNGDALLAISADDLGHTGPDGAKTGEAGIAITVKAVNDAPAFIDTDAVKLTTIAINSKNHSGDIVSFWTRDAVRDADVIANAGVAVVYADVENGSWQYSLTDQRSWTDFPTPLSETNALSLPPTAFVRFVPDTDFEGRATIRYRAWDASDGKPAASLVTTLPNGDATAFSTEIVTASITVGNPVILEADAGPDQTVVSGAAVTLDGSGSEFPDGVTTTLRWTQISGTTVALSNAAIQRPTFTAPAVESGFAQLVFQLTLTAGEATDQDTVVVTVTPDMSLLANAGADFSVVEGATAQLNGTGSRIPDGVNAFVEWTQTSGPAVGLSGATTLRPSFTAPEVGTGGAVLTFQLRLHDGEDQDVTDEVTVTVQSRPPVSANAGADQTVRETALVTLNGAGSQIPSGVTATYAWTQTGGDAVTLSNAATVNPTFTAPSVADNEVKVLTFTLTVTNTTDSSDKASDSVRISVTNLLAPVANAGPDQTVTGGTQVTLTGQASTDADGTVRGYAWTQTGGESVTLSGADRVTATFTAPDGGGQGKVLTFELSVTDDNGLKGTDGVRVTVAAAPGASQGLSVTEGETVTLSATPPDGFGAVTATRWVQNSGLQVTLSSATADKPTFVAPPVTASQSLVFTATMTNASGTQTTGRATVEVKDNGITGFPADAYTLKTSTGKAIGVKAGTGARLIRLVAKNTASVTDTVGRPVDLPYGLLDMDMLADYAGAEATIHVYLPEAAPAGYSWFKYDTGYGWFDFASGIQFSEDRKTITLRLKDGSEGDDDRSPNGVIVDPAGLGTLQSGNGTTDPPSEGGAGDGGGGCFISTVAPR